MNKYIIYFELFNNKMKAEIYARNKHEAKQKIINKIKWLDIKSDVDFIINMINKN